MWDPRTYVWIVVKIAEYQRQATGCTHWPYSIYTIVEVYFRDRNARNLRLQIIRNESWCDDSLYRKFFFCTVHWLATLTLKIGWSRMLFLLSFYRLSYFLSFVNEDESMEIWPRRLWLQISPTASLQRAKTHPMSVLWHSWLALQNTPTASLQRDKTSSPQLVFWIGQ